MPTSMVDSLNPSATTLALAFASKEVLKPAAFELSCAPQRLTVETSVLFGTLLGPAVVVTAQDPDADRERIHTDTDNDG